MKIIHVAGYSGSGKTRFIEELIGRLGQEGTVAAVKHLGHHRYTLQADKDTTRFFERGAVLSAGVDSEKSVLVVRDGRLDTLLRILCDQGIEYAIIEGFKSRPFPKVIIGDLIAENCVLRNPPVEEVIRALDRFEDFFTMAGLVAELRRESDMSRAGAILTFNGIVREWTGDAKTEYMDFNEAVDRKVDDILQEMKKTPGILGVRFHHRKGRLYAGDDITYIAVLAEHRQEAFLAVSRALDKLKKEVHTIGKDTAEV
jgi:molybdopterin synthase catalytic subunit